MSVELRVPAMGESISEATVLVWLKKEGEAFSVGDDLVELETDKANTTLPAEQSGVIEKILYAENSIVGPNDILALLSVSSNGASIVKPIEQVATPAIVASSAPATSTPPHATPLATKVAAAEGVDLKSLQGSGAGGKIVKEDVNRVVVAPISAPAVSQSAFTIPANSAPDDARVERRPMTRRRKMIADNLKHAQNTAAILTTFNEADLTAIMEIRKRRKEEFLKRNGIGLGFMSFFTRATIGALKAFPLLNAEIQGTDLIIKRFYDIGIAVGAKEGLVVPVLRDADQKTFAQIENKSYCQLFDRHIVGSILLLKRLLDTKMLSDFVQNCFVCLVCQIA